MRKSSTKERSLLIDGDLLLYHFAFANQADYDWGDVHSVRANIEKAKKDIVEYIYILLEKLNCKKYLVCLSDTKNFRYDVLPTYKHNRKERLKPILLEELRQYVLTELPSKTLPYLEGDDVLGLLATMHPNKYILASFDKDLKQIPALHYDWKKDEQFVVQPKEAQRWFYTQVLSGDSGDGYSGCPKIGSVKAEKLLAEVPPTKTRGLEKAFWEIVINAYKKAGLEAVDALQQARVARILRKGNMILRSKCLFSGVLSGSISLE